MRVIALEKDADLKTLKARLLKADLSSAQAESALAALQAANPHVNIGQLRAGAMLFIPDAPGLSASAGSSAPGGVANGFQQLVRAALRQAETRSKASHAARASERAELAALLKDASLHRLLSSHPDLRQQISQTTEALEAEEREASKAEETFAAAAKAALSKLAQLAAGQRSGGG